MPRALSFSLSLALPTIKRGEASVGERREELWREFFDKLGTVNNKSFEISSTYPDIFKVGDKNLRYISAHHSNSVIYAVGFESETKSPYFIE